MKHSGLVLVLGLALLGVMSGAAGAQEQNQELAGVSPFRFQTAVVVDVAPLQAVVVIDGHPIGVARELVARATAVLPGWHTLEIGAPGFYPYVQRFLAQPRDSVNLFTVTLAPVLQ